jgi:hypothetical protein
VSLHRIRRVGDWRKLRGVRDLLCRELSIDRISCRSKAKMSALSKVGISVFSLCVPKTSSEFDEVMESPKLAG